MVNLRAEAAAEVRRLRRERRFTVDGDGAALAQAEAEAPWIAIARRNRIRRALGSRLLLVWRAALEDHSGRRVESCLVPIAVDLARARRGGEPRRWIEAIVRELEPQIRARIDTAAIDWRQAAESMAAAFHATRAARERAIALGTAAAGAAPIQPGLFDRRAERALAQRTADAADVESAAAVRLAAVARSGAIGLRPAQLLVVLAP